MDEVVAYQQTVGGVTTRYYPHYNHLYSVAALMNAAGAVVERYNYDAYGKQTITSTAGAVRAKSAVGWDRGFTGYVADQETGLLHARARQYSPTLGRFVGRDPMEYVDGTCLYAAYFVPDSLDPYGQEFQKIGPEYVDQIGQGTKGGVAIPNLTIKGKCSPCKAEKNCWKLALLTFKVEVRVSIARRAILNGAWGNRTNANMDSSLRHENTHVDSMRAWHDKMEAALPGYFPNRCGEYWSFSECEVAREVAEIDVRRDYDKAVALSQAHQDAVYEWTTERP